MSLIGTRLFLLCLWLRPRLKWLLNHFCSVHIEAMPGIFDNYLFPVIRIVHLIGSSHFKAAQHSKVPRENPSLNCSSNCFQ